MKIFYLLALLLFPSLTIAQDEDTTSIDMSCGGCREDYCLDCKFDPLGIILPHKPYYPKGGFIGLSEWCMERTLYSQNMADSGIYGKLWFKVVVDSLGKVSNPKLIGNIGKNRPLVLVKESIRLISEFPHFMPGKCRYGKNAASRHVIGFDYRQDTLLKGKITSRIHIYPKQD